jgi:hypothetical protein
MGLKSMFDPSRVIASGTSLLLVRPTFRPPAMQTAMVQRVAGNVLGISLPLGEDLEEGEEVLLVLHVAGVRVASAARFVSREGHVVIFHVDGEWRSVDARSNFRFPAAHPATLRFDNAPEMPGTIVDVSPQGLGVVALKAPPSLDAEVTFSLRGVAWTLPCWVVAQKPEAEHFRLSLSYRDLEAEQQAAADRLVDFYLQAFESTLPMAG